MKLSILSVAALAAAVGALAAGPALAAGAVAYKAPRTASGQPDLQGVWTNATITPLERAPELGERLVLSEQEAQRAESGNAARVSATREPTKASTKVDDLPSCGGGQTGPACGYNAFWVDPGTKVIRIGTEARSSIIVSPKNGTCPVSLVSKANPCSHRSTCSFVVTRQPRVCVWALLVLAAGEGDADVDAPPEPDVAHAESVKVAAPKSASGPNRRLARERIMDGTTAEVVLS